MLKIEGKTFMNIQEAVQWLLDNNALPFQSTANYAGNTEIGMGTIVNPSPASIKVGALVLFADSKVGTVTGLTSNGFIVGSQYTDLHTALNYISNVAIDASGDLIVYLSNGETINAGRVKQISRFSIDDSQHLIANYNDSTTQDLGAIFSGNVNIAGNFTADSIIENMSGYSKIIGSKANINNTDIYTSVVKTGNKITFVHFVKLERTDTVAGGDIDSVRFSMPYEVASKLYPFTLSGVSNMLDAKVIPAFSAIDTKEDLYVYVQKDSTTRIIFNIRGLNNLALNTEYLLRIEVTFLLSDPLA